MPKPKHGPRIVWAFAGLISDAYGPAECYTGTYAGQPVGKRREGRMGYVYTHGDTTYRTERDLRAALTAREEPS